jgi:hypothetical protein
MTRGENSAKADTSMPPILIKGDKKKYWNTSYTMAAFSHEQ